MADEKTKRLVFLCSGGGGNLAFVHQMIELGRLPGISIIAVLTDRICQANNYAARVGLESRCLDFKEHGQLNLLSALDEFKPDLIITTVHKILQKAVVERYRTQLINLHYSLLPAFGGLIGAQSVQASLDYGVFFSGVTVHSVDESVDGGKPLVQCVIALQKYEPLEDLMQVVFRCGCMALLGAVRYMLEESKGKFNPSSQSILGRICLFNGGTVAPDQLFESEDFWRSLKLSLEERPE